MLGEGEEKKRGNEERTERWAREARQCLMGDITGQNTTFTIGFSLGEEGGVKGIETE